MDGKKALLVAGTHGKTTTSSVLTHVLKELGQKPSYAVGGTLSFDGPHADYDEGLYFVAEADESDGSFLKLSPFGLIVTNIDQDHMDYWQTSEKLEEGFKEFMSLCQDKNFCIYCGDDPILAQMGVIGTTYGSQDQTHFRLVFDQASEEGREFLILDHDRVLYKSHIPLNGHHNALNALAVFSLLRRLGFEAEAILKALSTFKGVDRRCQIKGQILGSVWIDDYGHHPTEIKATLEGLIDKYPNKSLCVIFQPHRFSRTFDLWNEFHKAFSTNYRLIVTDIYGCQEENPHGLSAEKLVIKIKEALKGPVEYVQRDLLSSLSFQEEIVVTFGAGDITHLYDETLCQLT
jgi:UDP-N-acetylmuramate--alanine ligase